MESKIFEFVNFSDYLEIKIGFLVGVIIYLFFVFKVKHSRDVLLMAFPLLVFASFLHFDAIRTCFYQSDGIGAYGLANVFIGDNYWNIDEFTAFYKRTQIFFYIVLFINGIGFVKRTFEAMTERKKRGRYYY